MEISHEVDLEDGGAGGRRPSSDRGVSDDESLCFSDDEEDSCYSQFYSTADRSHDDCSVSGEPDPETAVGDSGSRRDSSASESDYSVDIENGIGGMKVHLGGVGRDCRICHLGLESGIAIELGCSCKDDLGAAHRNCAEAWFKIRGNKTCEICNSVARNVFVVSETESIQQPIETNVTAINSVLTRAPVPPPREVSTCINGHLLVNFLLACMVFAFVISWLFHFNVPS
ncbi:hypothetical protein NMG60_11005332 [Bertholletia excelsa]